MNNNDYLTYTFKQNIAHLYHFMGESIYEIAERYSLTPVEINKILDEVVTE